MNNEKQDAATWRRGDTVKVVRLTGHRVRVSTLIRTGSGPGSPSGQPAWGGGSDRAARFVSAASEKGFTLIELVITLTVMTILTLGAVPLVKVAVRRQKEQELRETLRTIRAAIDQFHREAVIANCQVQGVGPNPNPVPQGLIDPRVKVAVSDCTIFGVDNPDRYPPELQTLVDGVNVIPYLGFAGGRGQPGVDATRVGELSTKKKIYLRAIPVDPITGKAEWDLRSCYDTADSTSWGGENVFDVRSKSKDTALNGEKYSDW